MKKLTFLIFAGIFSSLCPTARGLPAENAKATSAVGILPAAAQNCGGLFSVIRTAKKAIGSDSQEGSQGGENAKSKKSSDLLSEMPAPNECELLMNFQVTHEGEPARGVSIWRKAGNTAFFYESGMTIDADGAPNAYHPRNFGLDDLANAGMPGYWPGLAKDNDGRPFIQGPNDPYPGYYVSATALYDPAKPVSDPKRYVDSTKIPFVVLPSRSAREIGVYPGDFAVVFNLRNGKSSFAIVGDTGPSDRIGEGSVALAERLGIWADARNGGVSGGVLYLVFPGSGNRRPQPVEAINELGQELLSSWVDD